MKKFLLVFLLLLTGYASAEMLSYSATSKKSQKDADQLALEGLAKQLRTKVSSEFEVRTTEDAKGNVSQTTSSRKSSMTNIVIKGAKVVPGPKQDGTYQSTATVDTEQMASKILVDLSSIRTQMKEKDSIIRFDMVDGDYRKMATDMVALEKLADSYNEGLENLSCLQSVPAELKLESTLGELTEYLISSMSSLNMETDLTSEALVVTVSDAAGPVNLFPLALTQDNKDIAHEKTNAEGEAVFSLKQVKKLHPTGDVTVHADLNFKYVRQSALLSKSVHYETAASGKTYRLNCNASAEACGALQKYLGDAGIATLDKKGLPELKATLEFTTKANSNKSLYTTRATITLASGNKQMTESTQGVGRDEGLAQIKAIQKLPATKINQVFGK